MDTLTHALSGALLARATAPSKPRPDELTPGARMVAGSVAAAFPDCDFALRLIDTLTYLNWHQGVTHSVALLPVWALLLAGLFSRFAHRRYRWQAFFGVAFLGIAIHIAADLFTAYGTMLLAPFSTQRFSLPFAFVIDPYFSALMAASLAAAILTPARRHPAVIGFIVLGCYVGLLGVLYARAVGIGKAYAAKHGLLEATIHALPQPPTPFNWKVIVSHRDNYHVALVNLWRRRSASPPALDAGMLRKIAVGYRPVSEAVWQCHGRFSLATMTETAPQEALAREAWNHEAFADFRRFAMFPTLDRIEYSGDRVCVWFHDLRFTLPSLPPSFQYGLCRSGSTDDWQLARGHSAFWID